MLTATRPDVCDKGTVSDSHKGWKYFKPDRHQKLTRHAKYYFSFKTKKAANGRPYFRIKRVISAPGYPEWPSSPHPSWHPLSSLAKYFA